MSINPPRGGSGESPGRMSDVNVEAVVRAMVNSVARAASSSGPVGQTISSEIFQQCLDSEAKLRAVQHEVLRIESAIMTDEILKDPQETMTMAQYLARQRSILEGLQAALRATPKDVGMEETTVDDLVTLYNKSQNKSE